MPTITEKLVREVRQAPPIKLQIDALEALKLCGMLQLAMRHPQMKGEKCYLLDQLVEQLKPIGPTFRRVVMMGFDERFDRNLRESDGFKGARGK